MRKLILLFIIALTFASVSEAKHKDLLFRAAKPPVMVATYPVRHPVKDAHAAKATAKVAYSAFRFVF